MVVRSANPLWGIEVAVTHQAIDATDDSVWLPEQRITVEEAVQFYTEGASYVNFLEKETGTLEVGKYADIIVLDKNIFTIEPHLIHTTKVIATFLGGSLVHDSCFNKTTTT